MTVRSLLRSASLIAVVNAALPSPGAPLTGLIRNAGRAQATALGAAISRLGPFFGTGLRTALAFFSVFFAAALALAGDVGGIFFQHQGFANNHPRLFLNRWR